MKKGENSCCLGNVKVQHGKMVTLTKQLERLAGITIVESTFIISSEFSNICTYSFIC